jgi:hypothetical protein
MAARDYMIRKMQAIEAAREAWRCPGCGHGDAHRTLPRSTLSFDPALGLVETPNPDYRPFHMHCEHEGCECVQVLG